MFENSINYINNKPEPETVTLNLEHNPSLNLGYAIVRLENEYVTLPDNELYSLIEVCYENLLADIFNNTARSVKILDIVTDKRFLTIFIQVMQNKIITEKIRLFCNKLSYDYLIKFHENGDKDIKDLFLRLSKAVNKDIIPQLIAVGIPADFAAHIALCRFSALKENVNIMRVNHALMSAEAKLYEPDLMTEQNIIYIIERIYNKFSPVFKYTMMDVYTTEELNNIGPCAAEIYSNISLAIIDILNEQPSQLIRDILFDYTNEFRICLQEEKQFRFPMKSLAVSDYKRIYDVMDMMERVEKVIVK